MSKLSKPLTRRAALLSFALLLSSFAFVSRPAQAVTACQGSPGMHDLLQQLPLVPPSWATTSPAARGAATAPARSPSGGGSTTTSAPISPLPVRPGPIRADRSEIHVF